jgi:hypothetical protein
VAEFEGLGLEVTGVMVNPTNPEVAVALVNGRSVRRGEPVLGHDDVLVLDVRRDGVDFQYQGERIFRRRQEGGSASAQGPGGRGQPVKAPGRGAPPAGNRSGSTGAKAPAASADRTPRNPPASAPMTDPTVPADPGR